MSSSSRCIVSPVLVFFFFFNDTATTEIYTLSLHDALPICLVGHDAVNTQVEQRRHQRSLADRPDRSEEHTSELQSRRELECRLLLEKKKAYLSSFRLRSRPWPKNVPSPRKTSSSSTGLAIHRSYPPVRVYHTATSQFYTLSLHDVLPI